MNYHKIRYLKRKEKLKEYYNKPKVKKHKKEYNKEYRKKNKERIVKQRKRYYEKNKKQISEQRKGYYQKNKEKLKKYSKDYRKENPKKVLEQVKKWRKKNKDKTKEYKNKHKKKIRVYDKERRRKPEVRKRGNETLKKYRKNRRKLDKEFGINLNLRTKLWFVLNEYVKTGKIMSSKKYGINYQAIIEHLKPFPKDLSKYEIHHIKPFFTFNFVNKDGSTNLKEVSKAFAPKNHKWVTKEEHKRIHRKLNRFNLK